MSEFDRQMKQLGLNSHEDALRSPRLRTWVTMNWKDSYVPEALLFAWGFNLENIGETINQVKLRDTVPSNSWRRQSKEKRGFKVKEAVA